MRKTFIIATLLLFAIGSLFVMSHDTYAGVKYYAKNSRVPQLNVTSIPFWTPNRIGDYIGNQGQFVSFLITGSAGLEWPVGSGNTAHFAGGIWLGGIKNNEIVTAAGEFAVEFQPGKVLDNGQADNPQDPKYRVYIINKADVVNPLGNPDYMEWPVDDGAPVDENGNPLIIGSSTIWAVFNDFNPTLHNNLFQTKPMNVEVQMTGWAFDRPDAFGDMLFLKYKFINKGGVDIDSTFVGIWNDIDVGDALDLVGSDTTLSLGFMYKTQDDGSYGSNPPAVGTDFFQGPIVPSPGDVANVSGRLIPDFKNLPMTSLAKYINGGPPQFSDPENGPEMYNFMNGLDALGGQIIDPTTGNVTSFWHPGDPVAGTGWLDDEHKDKRYLMNSGPFTLAAGDTQEVVFGVLIAQGNTGVQSVELLKQADAIAQLAYDNNFALPPSPPNPIVSVSTEEDAITLNWDAAAESYVANDPIDIDAGGNPTQYTFEGYNVYQLDAPVITSQTTVLQIATFDIIDGVVDIRDRVFAPEIGQTVDMVVQKAEDSGLSRHLRITADAINGNAPLIQNRKYYFAVTAYGYNPLGIPRILESSIVPMTIRPQSPPLGTDLSAAAALGDTLSWGRLAGASDGSILPIVVDQTQLTGDSYEVRFRIADSGPDSGSVVYDVVDVTTGETKASGFKNQSDALGETDYPVVDGVMVKVIGAPNGFKNFLMVANAAGPIDPPTGAAADFRGFPVPNRPGSEQQVGDAIWFFNVGGGSNDGTFDTFLARSLRGSNFSRVIPFDWEMRFTGESWATRAFVDGALLKVPFELWNVGVGTHDDPSDDYRLIPWFLSNGAVGGLQTDPDGMTYQLDPNDSGASGGSNDPYTPWIYWRNPADTSPGEAGYTAFISAIDTTVAFQPGVDGSGTYDFASPEVFARTILVSWNGDDVSDGEVAPGTQMRPEDGSIIRIISTKPNTPTDVFSFQGVPPVVNNSTLAKQQAAELVNVYPNPYRGFNIEETDPSNRFVTFTHLPEGNTTIQVFTIAGELLKTIQHTNGTQFEQWDLRNDADVPVASGMYIVRIDMRSIGVKILKLAVFQPEERLDVF